MNAILEERLRQAKSQKRLAREAGIDARTLRKIEKGEFVSLESRRMVCSALGVDPHTVFEIGDDAPRHAGNPQKVNRDSSLSVLPRFLETALLSMAVVVVLGALFVLGHNAMNNWPNARIVVDMAHPCRDRVELDIGESLRKALPAASLRSIAVSRGTGTCAVSVDLKSEEKPEAIVGAISSAGLTGRLEVYRPVVPLWNYASLRDWFVGL